MVGNNPYATSDETSTELSTNAEGLCYNEKVALSITVGNLEYHIKTFSLLSECGNSSHFL